MAASANVRGSNARYFDRPRSSNPHNRITDRQAWMDWDSGWSDADYEIRMGQVKVGRDATPTPLSLDS